MSAEADRNHDYLRVRISCRLRTESPLHCGDGGALEVSESPWKDLKKGGKGHINTLCRGPTDPYIPASSLRGSLRQRCRDAVALFGEARGDEGEAGALRVYDAFLRKARGAEGDRYWNPTERSTLRDGVSIDPITGTAAKGKLFIFEVIPPGACFDVEMEADRLRQDQLAELLGLLQGWDGSAAAALGKGRTRGWGRVSLDGTPVVKVLTDEDIVSWAADSKSGPPQLRAIDAPTAHPPAPPDLIRIGLILRPDSPLLINEPARVRPKQQDADPFPNLEFMRDADGQALIPGSSLRGALRGRAGRILATIAHHQGVDAQKAGESIDSLIRELFGTEGQRSILWLGDARATDTNLHPQQFNAVDRFTGGVADKALYSVVAADCAHLQGEAVLDLARVPENDWWKGLLLLLGRDLIEGDIPVGWGKSRGYGAFSTELALPDGKAITDFENLLAYLKDHYGETTPRRWVEALHREIAHQVEQSRTGLGS